LTLKPIYINIEYKNQNKKYIMMKIKITYKKNKDKSITMHISLSKSKPATYIAAVIAEIIRENYEKTDILATKVVSEKHGIAVLFENTKTKEYGKIMIAKKGSEYKHTAFKENFIKNFQIESNTFTDLSQIHELIVGVGSQWKEEVDAEI